MRFPVRLLAFACAALSLAGCAGQTPTPTTAATRPAGGKPTLIVLLVADQMRTDYLQRAAPHLTGGLRRLTTEGAWFTEAAYPYLNTVTCAGHSTIGTGALPYQHGMVLNAWWERTEKRDRACTSDPDVKNIGYTGTPAGGDSARWLLVPTLGQRVREANGRTVAMSLKPRSAITLGGQGATSVVWLDDRQGWTTSTAFTKAPLPWLQEFITSHPVAGDAGKTWARALSASAYIGPDDGDGERFPAGWTRTFPHVLNKTSGPEFIAHWTRTPFADEYLARMAMASVDALQLGQRGGLDFLAVSFSSLDLAGHQFGPASHEVQDIVVRLDRTIGMLFDHLDARVGRGRYVVAFSSDHGVGPMPEQTSGSGRQTSTQTLAAIDKALVPFLGPGKYAQQSVYTDLYLVPGVLERLKDKPQATAAVLDALRAMPGIAYAFTADEVATEQARQSSDPIKRAAALSYHAGRSGDLIIVPKPHWMLSTSSATTHGTLYPYDQRVPVLFYGPGVTPGERTGRATPADIAPTLARLAGFPFRAPDGQAHQLK
jgi:predicted AlkP superfamily pyrophosphatase or phosphodiesterase